MHPLTPPPPQKDALRELAQRGHDSVYQKGHASESNEEITSPGMTGLVGVAVGMGVGESLNRPMQREKASLSSLKRASVNVELLAPRSPMGKETMVTFSNTLPRPAAANNPAGAAGTLDEALPHQQQRRLVTVPVPVPLPMDALQSQQLVSEWKQKSMEMRGMSLREQQREQEEEEEDDEEEEEEEDGSEEGSDETTPTEEETATSSLYPSLHQHPLRPPIPPAGARVVLPPRPPVAPQPPHLPHPHLPGDVPVRPPPPPVSPKSASTRAKWLSLTEKSGAAVPSARAPGQPRLMQVIAMSKQQGLLSGSGSPRSSETASASSSSVTSSSTAGTDSPPYRPPSERDTSGIITVDAHAPHHPVVQAPSNTNPWEWRGNVGNTASTAAAAAAAHAASDPRESYELNDLNRGYRVSKAGSASGEHRQDIPPPPPQPEVPLDGRSRQSLRRKTPLVLLEQGEHGHAEQDPYYRKLPTGHRFKE